MTKQELNRYFWLCHEIDRQQKRLERMRNKKNEGVVGDTVKNYKTGRGVPMKIEGIAADELSRPMMIAMLEEEIQANIEESEKAVKEIEGYIQSVEEPKMRELLRSRFIDCLNWEKVGEKNYMAPDYARRLIRNFIKNLK